MNGNSESLRLQMPFAIGLVIAWSGFAALSAAEPEAPAPSSSFSMPGWVKSSVDWVKSAVGSSPSPQSASPADSKSAAPANSNVPTGQGQATSLLSDFSGLKDAVAKHEYAQAETYGKKLDELLKSDAISKSIAFLKLEAEKGSDAAIAEVERYLGTPDLKAESRKAGEAVLAGLKSVERDDAVAVVTVVAYLLLEHKLGHEAGAIAPYAGLLTDDIWRWVESSMAQSKGNSPAGTAAPGEANAAAFTWEKSNSAAVLSASWELAKMIANDPAAQEIIKDLKALAGLESEKKVEEAK